MTEVLLDTISHQPELAPFWRELEHHRLSFPHCARCDKFHWYPMKRCPTCLTEEIEWVPISGDARLYSWTTVHHRFDPTSGPEVPYIVALLEFPNAPGIRLISNVVDTDPIDLKIGMALIPCFGPLEAGNSLDSRVGLTFQPAIKR